MRRSMHRLISILLAVVLTAGVFAILPVTVTADAAANTSDAWIFAVNDGRTYDLDGKWVRFGDEDFQLSGTGELTLTNRTTYIYQLKYGTTRIADSRNTQAGAIHIGDTVYVTGRGTEEHPYIFTPNIIFYDNTVTTFGNGATVSLGYENLEATASGNNGVAVPGDGFRSVSRMQVGAANYVRFLQHDETDYQPNQVSTVLGYIGVKDGEYGTYNGSGNFTNATNHFSFESGNDTLYYLGREEYGENGLYLFSETFDKRTSFSGTNKVICTVVWENQDGTKLKTMTYNLGDTPDDGGLTPSKAEDAAYTYAFTGFEPAYAPLTDDVTYVATYDATPKGPMTYSVKSWIFPTNDGKEYEELDGMCYSYNGGEATGFHSGGSFSVENDQLLLCGIVVADIDTSKPYKTFANTVFVSGAGSQEDPFIFHPNYIYAETAKSQVKDGPAIAVDEAHAASGDKGVANPGDGFKAMSRIRVGNARVQFMQKNGYYSATRNLLGVGETTYGYRYSKTKALPFTFVSDDHTLYYYEKTDAGIYQFSETKPPKRNTFRPADSTYYTVTWKNADDTVLDTETYYVNDEPVYKGETPSLGRSGTSTYTYTGGWTPAVEHVTQDATYTASYTEDSGLFKGYTLTLDGDIGLNFFLNVTDEEVRNSGVTAHFAWTVKGTAKSADYTIPTDAVRSNGYYKATCWMPAAEMNYDITATVSIGGTAIDASDTYKIKTYAEYIIGTPAGTYGAKHDQLVDLVKKMLDYGAKAQTSFDRLDVPLANTGVDYTMTEIDAADIPRLKSNMKTGTDAFGLAYQGTTIVYLSKTSLRHYYKVTDQTAFESAKAAAIESGFTCGEKSGMVYFEKSNIPAKNLGTNYPISFGSGSSYNFSVLDYSGIVLDSASTSAADKALAMATYWYGKAAVTYFS